MHVRWTWRSVAAFAALSAAIAIAWGDARGAQPLGSRAAVEEGSAAWCQDATSEWCAGRMRGRVRTRR
jgi:hypothetical protein